MEPPRLFDNARYNDLRSVPGRASQTAVCGQQRHLQRFREGDIGSVVWSVVVAQFPDPIRKWSRWVPDEGRSGEIVKGLLCPFRGQLTSRDITPQRRDDLEMSEIEGMQGGGSLHTLRNGAGSLADPEEPVDQR